MVSYPEYPGRTVTLLDGIWDFVFLGEQADPGGIDFNALVFTDKTAVPGCFDTDRSLAGIRGTAVYRKLINVTPRTPSVLKFHGLGISHMIYVDRHLICEDSLPYTGFLVALPPSESDVRELLVVIDNRFDFERAPLQEQFFDFYAYGGIFRSVELMENDELCMNRLRVVPLDLQAGTILIELDSSLEGESLECQCSFDRRFPQKVTLYKKKGYFSAVLQVPEHKLWSLADPSLHTVFLQVGKDSIRERFGMRTIAADQGKILLNGEPVKLKGVCRHEAHPVYGPALPLQQLVQDLKILKEMGCNFIRGSHYSQDQRFLDLCDEMGFLVFEESLASGQKEKQLTDRRYNEMQIRQTGLMVQNSFNHPSVIIWGFLNEGESHREYARPLYEALLSTVRSIDTSRLVSYATMHPYEDLFLDQVDVVSVNIYPGWYSGNTDVTRPLSEIPRALDALIQEMDRRVIAHKPLIITEIGAGALYGWHDSLKAHWSEEYQADLLELVANEIMKRDSLAGVSLWQFCDSRTYSSSHSLSRPRGFNNKGILDEYRRPKLAFERVKKVFRSWDTSTGE